MPKHYVQFSFFLVIMLFLAGCTVNENGQMVVQLVQPEAEASAAEASEQPAFQPPSFETVEVADGLYSFGNGRVYAAFMVTDEGVIVLDSINPMFAAQMLAAIKGVTDQPIRYLLYSHNHWDHIAGGQVFKDAGATILGHIDIHEWLINHPAPNPRVAIPDETWTGERHDVVLGGKTVELYHFGQSHGEGMTIFRFPEAQAIFTADVVTPKRLSVLFMPDFSPRGWISTLEAVEQLEFETVMFAHNAPFGPRSAVTEQREYLQDLRVAVMARLQAGEDPVVIAETIELPKYQEWGGYDDWLGLNAWRVMLEFFMGQ